MYFPKADMDFNVKKLVRDAGTALSRVVQVCYSIVNWYQYRSLGGMSISFSFCSCYELRSELVIFS
jgi:hypothetical protein